MELQFFEQALDSDLAFAVVAAQEGGQWLLRRENGAAWVLPRADRLAGERIAETAQRALETQLCAHEFQLEPVSAYCVFGVEPRVYGALYFARIDARGTAADFCAAAELPAELAGGEVAQLLAAAQGYALSEDYHDAREDIFTMFM